MITPEIVAYVRTQLQAGSSREKITSDLQSAKWTLPAISAVFAEIDGTTTNASNLAAQESVTTNTTTRYAGFWIRYAALAVDSVVISVAMTPVQILVGISMAPGVPYDTEWILQRAVLITAHTLLVWVYSIWMLHATGATLGKMFFGLRVVTPAGGRPTLGKYILRETIGRIAAAWPLFIGYFWIAADKKKQGWHDKIAKTVVVHRNPKGVKGWKKFIAAILIALPLLAMGGIAASVILASLSVARQKMMDEQPMLETDMQNINETYEDRDDF